MPATESVLVTGAAGFIGSTLVDRLLADGRRVLAVDDLSTGRLHNLDDARRTYPGRLEFQRLDVTSGALDAVVARHRPRTVVHLAGQVSVAHSLDDPLADAHTNVLGTVQVLEAARRHDVAKVVFTCTAGLYGDPDPDRLPIDEHTPARPSSPYVAAKLAAEGYLRAYGASFGLAWTSIVPANVYGPRQVGGGDGGVVAVYLERMRAGSPVVIHGDGEQTRDFCFVDDVVHALALALDKGDGERINVGTGRRCTINELFAALAAATGYGHEPIAAPARPGDVRHSALDASKAASVLGWKPWTTLEEGLAATVDASPPR